MMAAPVKRQFGARIQTHIYSTNLLAIALVAHASVAAAEWGTTIPVVTFAFEQANMISVENYL
jgi:hypothetical protein